MTILIGYILILLGLLLIVIGVLAWLGVVKPSGQIYVQDASPIDLLLKLLERAPWTVVVGLLLIYAGLKMIGVALPF
jgi:hypothetical protein